MVWRPVPINAPWYPNLPERALRSSTAVLENLYVTEAGGHASFPQLRVWKRLNTTGRVYLHTYDDELFAVTSNGRAFTIDRNKVATGRTAQQITVSSRPTFARTEDYLLIASGGPIMRFAGGGVDVLSATAPQATHVIYTAGYALALDRISGRIRYSDPVEGVTSWPLGNVFSADDKPDPITALMLTDQNDIVVCGPETIELFQVYGKITPPFYRRSSLGEGLYAPHTLCETKGAGLWCVNGHREFIQVTSGGGRLAGEAVGRILETAVDYRDAWASELHMAGQKFIVLSLPNAVSPYGRKGVTLLYDYRSRRWSSVYLWDAHLSGAVAWPVWSLASTSWGTFAGCENGLICELVENNVGMPQRGRYRSAHIAASALVTGADQIYVSNLRLRLVVAPSAGSLADLTIRVRGRMDRTDWLDWQDVAVDPHGSSWAEFGSMGTGRTMQIEYETFRGDALAVAAAEADVEALYG